LDIGIQAGTTCTVRDLWKEKNVGSATDSYTATVASHGVVFVTLTPNS